MTEEEQPQDPFNFENFDPRSFWSDIRKSASVKIGATIFGQAQVAYFDTLKEGGMSEEMAYNMLAHTTEVMLRSLAEAAGPVCSAVLSASAMWQALGLKPETDKEVPGSS